MQQHLPPRHPPPCVFTLTWSGDSQSPSASLVLGFGIPVHLVPLNILTCSELWERGGRRWRWPSWRLEIKTARDRRGVGVSGDRSGGAVGLGSFFCHFWFGFSWLPVEMIHYNHGSQRRNAQLHLAPSPCSFPASFTFLLRSQQSSDSSNLSSALIFLYTTSDLFSFLDRPRLLVFRQWPASWECSAFWYHWLAADKGLTLSKVKSVNRSSFHHLTSFYPIALFLQRQFEKTVSASLYLYWCERKNVTRQWNTRKMCHYNFAKMLCELFKQQLTWGSLVWGVFTPPGGKHGIDQWRPEELDLRWKLLLEHSFSVKCHLFLPQGGAEVHPGHWYLKAI